MLGASSAFKELLPPAAQAHLAIASKWESVRGLAQQLVQGRVTVAG